VKEIPNNRGQKFSYSVSWLFINITLIIGSFILMNTTSWIIWSLAITGIIIMWSLRYKRALRQLSKPKFWIFFVLITLITAFVFVKIRTGENVLQQGLLTGLQMNFRAAVIIVGFSVLGTELYNPVVRNFFLRTSYKNLPLALELSAKSLPSFIANIPDFRSLIKNPVSIFYHVISQADQRLSEIKKGNVLSRKIFIVSGAVGEGKTTYAKKLIAFLRQNNIKVGGILSERVMTHSRTTGYDVVNIETGEKEAFLRVNEKSGYETIGRFTICPKGLAMGNLVLSSVNISEYRIIIIDEIGLLELGDKGWADSLNYLLERSIDNILINVRDSFVDKVIRKWDLMDAITFNIRETGYKDAGLVILEKINNQSGK
jgi:nucleoside-triphosphatase THEP1